MPKFTKRGVPLVRNNETLTEAQFWSMFRQAMRKLTMHWKPGTAYLNSLRRENQSDNKKLKFEYPCEHCKQWLRRDEIELDHVVECGSLSSWQELATWCERAFIEIDGGWQALCAECHRIKSNKTRSEK